MGEILAFISGCIFSLLLTGGCIYFSHKLLDYKENTDIRREEKKKELKKKLVPSPTGGVIKPKTQQEMENKHNEELKAFADLLSPSQDTE